MEVMRNVLIKECPGPDLVFIVDNLPKSLLFKEAKRLVFIPRYAVDYDPTFPKVTEAYVLRDENLPDEPRNRQRTGEMGDELLPGIEYSQTGDGGYVFMTELHEAKERLATIDRYIRDTLGPLAQIPQRVPYASQNGSFVSPPKQLSQLPRVELPAPVSPPANAVQEQDSTPVLERVRQVEEVPLTPKRRYTEEQKAAMRVRLAAARAKGAAMRKMEPKIETGA